MAGLACDIVTPAALLYSNDAYMVVVPGVEGEMGLLQGHVPLVSCLADGVVRIQIENGGALHLRKGPGTDTESLGYVQNGDKATILGESGEWYRVRVDGKEGYLKKIYLVG